MILAAGRGTRMRPLTDKIPKPLVEIGGRPVIARILDRLENVDVQHVTINLHYRGDMIEKYLKRRNTPQITFSRENELLETGGGIKKALGSLGPDPFYVVSGDSLWTDGPGESALERLATAWNPEKMDLLLLLQPVETMALTGGVGDYDIKADGSLIRTPDHSGACMWTSIRICKPELFDRAPNGPFSFLDLMDRAQAQGRLYGLIHDGAWHHISTAEDVRRVNNHLKNG